MKIKYVGCFEQVTMADGAIVKRGEMIELSDEIANGVIGNPGQWEIVKDAEKASGKGVK